MYVEKNLLPSYKIMLIAGEASGDAHGAEVVRALKAKNSGVDCFGIGGRKMAEAGCRLLFDSKTIAVMGLFEVLRHFKAIRRAWKVALEALKKEQPDCIILIDYPGFNLRFAEKVKVLGIKILYYISPQIWAWKKNRIHKIKRLVDYMAVILPFEEAIYKEAGIPVRFVGSPLLDQVKSVGKVASRQALALSPTALIVGLLPGSRRSEIARLLPILIEVSEILKCRYPDIQFVLPLADTIGEEDILAYPKRALVPILLVRGESHLVMQAADVLIGSSGTATLEAAILGVPMVVLYKMHPFTFAIAKQWVKIDFISLPNLLAKKEIYPEFIQTEAHPEPIAEAALRFIEDEAALHVLKEEVQALLLLLGDRGAGERVAEMALDLCHTTPV